MTRKNRFFLIVEGLKDGYPNNQSAKVSFAEQDPATLTLDNLFICSPLFSISNDGVIAIPKIQNGTKITFIMMPRIFPDLGDITKEFPIKNEVWFSLGLANLIIIEGPGKNELSSKIIAHLKRKKNITAFEQWTIRNHKIYGFPLTKIIHKQTEVVNANIRISNKLPQHLKFAVSEYIISVEKFLTASRKFTPYYFEQHEKAINLSTELLINDLSFLHGDRTFRPSESLLLSIDEKNISKAMQKLQSDAFKYVKEELINERNGSLIQFNSSMSYVYSQAYSGTFPIFDHTGIIRRHSLLGIGSAIGALFELISQVEKALYILPFEHLEDISYNSIPIPSNKYLKFFKDPARYNSTFWNNDQPGKKLVNYNRAKKIPAGFVTRLSFYSGRLGFREYDLSATAAIQVLSESNSLQWNIITYTHEIIHNHVRILLNQLLLPLIVDSKTYEEWLNKYLEILSEVYFNPSSLVKRLSYTDYFIITLINFCIKAEYHGSLTFESNHDTIIKKKTEVYVLPEASELDFLIKESYRDINEIFVHVIDFSYIYNQNIDVYVSAIWSSWSTILSVTYDLKQYIIRTLIVIALLEDGEVRFRYDKSKKKLVSILQRIKGKSISEAIFDKITTILSLYDDDIRHRFYNCVTISDIVFNCFVGDLTTQLNNSDLNVRNGKNPSYIVDTGSFDGEAIKSKVRLILDQLIRTIKNTSSENDEKKERISSWMLLTLSSFNDGNV